jgi:hypothetical protein
MQVQRPMFSLIFGSLLALAVLSASVESQQPAKPDDQQTVSSKAQKSAPAAGINFKKDLGLSYKSLGTLGSRIDAARRNHDAVGLANAANELAVAEKVSGKKASVTSSVLMTESAQLAKLKKEASELQAVERVANQVATETDLVTDLKKEIALSQQQAKAETDAIRANQEPGDAPRKVLINNYTTNYVDIWVNGYMKTTVGPGQSKWFVIEHKWNPTVLTAYGDEDITTWGPRTIWGNFKTYTWNLN